MVDRYLARRMVQVPFSGIRRMVDMAHELEERGVDVIHLDVGRPDADTPTAVKDRCIDAIRDGHVHYTLNAGIMPLRCAIADKIRTEQGVSYDPVSEIVVTSGASEAVYIALASCLDDGDEVLIPDPGWINYRVAAQMAGATVVPYPLLDGDGFVPDTAVLESLVSPRTRAVVLVSPGNPTGTALPAQALRELAQWCARHDLLVVSDEIYEKYVYGGVRHRSVASFQGMRERTAVVNGVSKTYSMTGWRIGWVAAPRAWADGMLRLHQYVTSCATAFAQYGALEAYSNRSLPPSDWLREYERRRDAVVEGLRRVPGISLVPPTGAFYAFPSYLPNGMDDDAFCRYILENAGVAVVPGHIFGRQGEGHFRVSFVQPEQRLKEAFSRMAQALEAIY